MSLQPSSSTDSQLARTGDGEFAISIYSGELTQKVAVESIARVKAAFPSLPPEFYKVFIERIKEKGFSDQRLVDAVNNVIDNCMYPTPTLANFLSFDRRVKLVTYNELCNLTDKGESFSSYARITIKGKAYYVRKCDKELYNVPDEL
jgi:hypothetical protein